MKHLFWPAIIVFLIDQAVKYGVIHLLNLPLSGPIEVLPPILVLKMGWNTGINFGLFSTQPWVLIGISTVICVLVLFWILRGPQPKLAKISAGLLIGGALGNIVDRIIYGAVADYLNMSCCGINNPFVFNLADVAIFLGAFGLILWAKEHKAP